MITPQRQEIIRLLSQLSELTPDVRFGQLIANVSYLAVAPTSEAIWTWRTSSCSPRFVSTSAISQIGLRRSDKRSVARLSNRMEYPQWVRQAGDTTPPTVRIPKRRCRRFARRCSRAGSTSI
jgi:hypothetical protein